MQCGYPELDQGELSVVRRCRNSHTGEDRSFSRFGYNRYLDGGFRRVNRRNFKNRRGFQLSAIANGPSVAAFHLRVPLDLVNCHGPLPGNEIVEHFAHSDGFDVSSLAAVNRQNRPLMLLSMASGCID